MGPVEHEFWRRAQKPSGAVTVGEFEALETTRRFELREETSSSWRFRTSRADFSSRGSSSY
jgi:hypothetical protein